QAAAKRKEKLGTLLFKAGAAVLVVLAAVVFWQGLVLAPPAVPPDQVSASDQVRGNLQAPVTLTVYADSQCPACLSETNLIARAWPQGSGRVRLVFRHYPLDIHRHAFLAARYAEAAGRQAAFWQMHDVLFANQTLWSEVSEAAPLFDSYAAGLGLDVAQLKSDIGLPELRDKILADQRSGTRAGVRSTPTLFLNGRLLASNPRSTGEL